MEIPESTRRYRKKKMQKKSILLEVKLMHISKSCLLKAGLD